jgi:hypothetical protein
VSGRVTSVDHPVDQIAVTRDVLAPWMGTAVQPARLRGPGLNYGLPGQLRFGRGGEVPLTALGSDRGGVDDVIRSVCAAAQDPTTLITDGVRR